MPTTNSSDSVALSINCRLHNFSKSGAPWIVTLSSSEFYKNLEFSFILNCTVPSLMSTISCKAAWSAKVKFASYWVIIDVAQTYRIPSDSLFITTLSIIETCPWWNVSLGLRMCVYRALISTLIWCNWFCHRHCPWFNAFMYLSVGSSFV